jgi:hypothetical protein
VQNTLAIKSVLMRFSAGVPGESRKDKRTTQEVQSERGISSDGGKWIKNLWPEDALKAVKQKQTEARSFHERMTLPFGCKDGDDGVDAISGMGILPAALLAEYGDKMREFKGQFDNLVETTFLADPHKWVDWAIQAHNGTFEPKNYPGASMNGGIVDFNADEFRKVMRKRFYLRTEPLPVPDASHFEDSIRQMLGQDAESVDLRLADAEKEARREVMRRMIAPLRAMAAKLYEPAPEGKESPIFRDSLVGNVKDIVELAPKLNITGDAQIDDFVKEMDGLTRYTPEMLRVSGDTRSAVAVKSEELLKRLEGYRIV